jgi:hypothetical protein
MVSRLEVVESATAESPDVRVSNIWRQNLLARIWRSASVQVRQARRLEVDMEVRATILRPLALGVLLWIGLSSHDQAEAGHTKGDRTCVTPVINCRETWTNDTSKLNVKLIDQFSPTYSYLYAPAAAAGASWNAAISGRMYMSFGTQANETYVYLKTGTNGQYYLGAGVYGIHSPCTHISCYLGSSAPMNVWYSEVYVNVSELATSTVWLRQWAFAHELGHALMLTHHTSGTNALMYDYPVGNPTGINGPVALDVGHSSPICRADKTTWGARCIYGWN